MPAHMVAFVIMCDCVSCRAQISQYETDRLKVQHLPHLQEAPAHQQVRDRLHAITAPAPSAGQHTRLVVLPQPGQQWLRVLHSALWHCCVSCSHSHAELCPLSQHAVLLRVSPQHTVAFCQGACVSSALPCQFRYPLSLITVCAQHVHRTLRCVVTCTVVLYCLASCCAVLRWSGPEC